MAKTSASRRWKRSEASGQRPRRGIRRRKGKRRYISRFAAIRRSRRTRNNVPAAPNNKAEKIPHQLDHRSQQSHSGPTPSVLILGRNRSAVGVVFRRVGSSQTVYADGLGGARSRGLASVVQVDRGPKSPSLQPAKPMHRPSPLGPSSTTSITSPVALSRRRRITRVRCSAGRFRSGPSYRREAG